MSRFFSSPVCEVIREIKRQGVSASFVHPEHIHLTLAFFEEITAEKIAEISGALKQKLASERFNIEVTLGRFGAFPNSHHPRVLWLAVVSENKDLLRLKVSVDDTLRRSGIVPEERAFKPHVTLARFREKRHALSSVKLDFRDVGLNLPAVKINELIVFQSVLQPSGSLYIPLYTIPLR